MLCELEHVARDQRNLVPPWTVVLPLVWATEGSDSFEGQYPMTAPIETLFSLLISEEKKKQDRLEAIFVITGSPYPIL